MLVGERAITMGRAFNVREGFGPQTTNCRGGSSPHHRSGTWPSGSKRSTPRSSRGAIKTYYYLMGGTSPACPRAKRWSA
jgi:hypothetical protein